MDNEVFLANDSNSQNLLSNLLKSSQKTNEILRTFVQSVDTSLNAKKVAATASGDNALHNSDEFTARNTFRQEPTEQRKISVKYGFLTLYEINSQDQTFNAEILIQLKWTDDVLEDVAQADTECYLQHCWTPDVKIFNLVKENVSQQQMFVSEEPAMNYQPIVVIRRKIQGVFKMKMQLKDFPFDYQDLPIILYSEHPRDKVLLKEDQHEFSYFNKDHFNHPPEWTIFDHVDIVEGNPNNILPTDFGQSTNVKVSSGKSKHVEMIESSYSSKGVSVGGVNERKRFVSTMSSFLTARCRVKRKPNFYLYNTCLTALFLVFIAFANTLFLMPVHSDSQLNDGGAAATRVIGSLLILSIMFNFRSMTSSCVPVVSCFTFIDKYLYAQTIYLSLVVALQALLIFVYQQNWSWIKFGGADINFCEMIVSAVLLITQIIAHVILFIRFKIRSRKSAAFIALCEKVYEHKISVILSNATKRRHSTQTEKARKGYARYIVAAKGSDGEKGNITGCVSVTIEKKRDCGAAAGLRSKDINGAGGSLTEGHTTKSVRFPSQS